jgi:hypothetical protein
MAMPECEPRIQVETCLAELGEELKALGVQATALRDDEGRACLEAHDRWGRPLRIYVYVQFYWFMWGVNPQERHSVFRIGETAVRLARLAMEEGWPHRVHQEDPTRMLDRFLH